MKFFLLNHGADGRSGCGYTGTGGDQAAQFSYGLFVDLADASFTNTHLLANIFQAHLFEVIQFKYAALPRLEFLDIGAEKFEVFILRAGFKWRLIFGWELV